jgi:hypothetical protein
VVSLRRHSSRLSPFPTDAIHAPSMRACSSLLLDVGRGRRRLRFAPSFGAWFVAKPLSWSTLSIVRLLCPTTESALPRGPEPGEEAVVARRSHAHVPRLAESASLCMRATGLERDENSMGSAGYDCAPGKSHPKDSRETAGRLRRKEFGEKKRSVYTIATAWDLRATTASSPGSGPRGNADSVVGHNRRTIERRSPHCHEDRNLGRRQS